MYDCRGRCLRKLSRSQCPTNPHIGACDGAAVGTLCETDGECETDTNVNNCPSANQIRDGTPQPKWFDVFEVVASLQAPAVHALDFRARAHARAHGRAVERAAQAALQAPV